MEARVQLVTSVVPIPARASSLQLQVLQQKIPAYLAGAVANSTAENYVGTFKRFSQFCWRTMFLTYLLIQL